VIFRRRFGELIDRQLSLFAEDNAELLERIAEAREAYDDAPREEAEEHYGDYQDLVAEGTEVLAELRDAYAETLDGGASAEYVDAFNFAVLRRFGDLALELEDEADDDV
jgi:hypothetical protein